MCKLPARQQTTHPHRAIIRLPRRNVPTGRPLHDDEWTEVCWTVAEEEDNAITNKVGRRQKRLLRLLRQAEEQGAAPTVKALAAALEVGHATIKRDLAALRRSGQQVRTRGSRSRDQQLSCG